MTTCLFCHLEFYTIFISYHTNKQVQPEIVLCETDSTGKTPRRAKQAELEVLSGKP